MHKRIGLLAAVLVTGLLILLWITSAGIHAPKAYEYLKEPRVVIRAPQKMLVVEVVGEPGRVVSQARGLLLRSFYVLKRSVRGLKLSVPRARWPRPEEESGGAWVGVFGMPLPDYAEYFPTAIQTAPPARIETWDYGKVAEVLHVGPYTEELETIKRLHGFIQAQGYAIVGPHEEEYLRGPGLLFQGNSKKYLTIIRYRIEKGGEQARFQSL